MSLTRNLLGVCDQWSGSFSLEFSNYLDSLDALLHLQSLVGFEREELSGLPEGDQDLVKGYLFLMESANTTALGALRLLSSNLHSDAYALVRILYEIACVMHYGNSSKEHKREVLTTIFKSGLSGKDQSRAEWKLTKSASEQFESEKPGLKDIIALLNNYGAHLSLAKVVGNMTALSDQSASRVFTCNFNDKHFLVGLELLYHVTAMVLEEYLRHLEEFSGASENQHRDVVRLSSEFIRTIRPKLQARLSNPG